MFCVVYEFKLRPDQHERFREAWHQVTRDVIVDYGSLGARLHSCDEDTWIAYAQWPDREAWLGGHKAIEARMIQLHLDQCLADIPARLLELRVIDDLLVTNGEWERRDS